jgi:ankyrin repeat protein/mono/diheme cytochrome c family protein
MMHGRNRYGKRGADVGVAILLFAGLSQSLISSPRTVRAGDRREAGPIAPDLIAAIRNADAQVVRMLIDNGADVNARDAQGNTPLILASFYASPKCVALLLEKGADANAANKAGVTALIRAATNYEKTRLLVDAGAKVGMRSADLGNTPLILAARRAGNSRTVMLLLERGASATEPNNAGVSPIMSGAASGDLETVQFLLDAGAKVGDYPKANDLRTAAMAGLRTPLMWAAYHNDERMIRLLLERGADPNQSTFFGTALSQACWNDGFEAAELLIDRGANVNARDAVADFTPLHWAAGDESLRPHLVKLLLGSGADPNAAGGGPVGAFGLVPQTPRLIAEKRGRTKIVAALAAAGAKDQPPPEKIATPRHALPQELDHSTIITAAEKALAALRTTAAQSHEAFLRHVSKQDCVSCHQQYLPMTAVGHARNRSIRFDQDAAREQIDLVVNHRNQFSRPELVVQALFHPDPAHTYGYQLLALAAERVPSSPMTDGEIHHLATIQASDGRWNNNIPRPPMQSTDVSATALAIHAIKSYGWPGRKEEFAASIERARRWLWKVKAETNEEMTFQLLGLHWAGESVDMMTCLVQSLRQGQRKDGGWAQLPTLESDAYATGEALYTLSQFVKDPMNDPAWRRGLRFLLETQEDDGTWHVARRAFPFQPTMNSGFPHHRDSWISAAATSWAVLALTQASPVGSASGKPAIARQPLAVRTPKNEQKIDFAQQVKPLLERSCAACHSGEKPRGLFRIDGRDAILKGGASGEAAIVPGHSDESPLIDYVSGNMPDSEMPPKAQRKRFPALKPDDIALLRSWIDQGADWPKGVSLSSPKGEGRR